MSDNFLLATHDKYDDNLRWLKENEVEDLIKEQRRKEEVKKQKVEEKGK